MIIKSILVRKFFPLKDVRLNLHPQLQFLIGLNGTGKTYLLRLICGLAGTDEATELVANQPIGEVELTVQDEGTIKTLYITDRINAKDIYKFKNSLSKRVSFPVTTWANSFVSQCDAKATDAVQLEKMFQSIWGQGLSENLIYTKSSDRTRLMVGDGFKRTMSLFLLDSPDGVPMLLDLPESHLDITGKRVIVDLLTRAERQLIIATHSPEVLSAGKTDHAIYDLTDQSALDA